jgi:hypothetical protein
MEYIKTTLHARTTEQATYIHQHKDECHEVTRDRILLRLHEWLSTPSDGKRCWWITGQPGVGKSAIAITVADCLKGRRPVSATTVPVDGGYTPRATLYGEFFINHKLLDTTDARHIFPTIALQLARSSPAAAILIHDALKANPTLAIKLTPEQADALFIKPMCAIAKYTPGVVVSLFDGVDELSNANISVLSSFAAVLSSVATRLPPNVKLLVFSRPEMHILNHLKWSESSIHRTDLLTEESREDVRRFLGAELIRIAELHELPNWPESRHVDLLSEFAAGHLGWAALAVRWIAREVEQKGNSKYIRESVFESVKQVQKGDLYDLYAFILSRVVPEDAEEAVQSGCRLVLGSLAVMRELQTIETTITLISLGDTFDILHFFKRISSIILSGLEIVDAKTIPCPHKSFIDWITSNYLETRFRIQTKEHHDRFVLRCFVIIKTSLHFNMAGLATSDLLDDESRGRFCDHMQSDVLYACCALLYHLREAKELTDSTMEDLVFIFKHCFLPWTEVTCTLVPEPNLMEQIEKVRDLVPVCALSV